MLSLIALAFAADVTTTKVGQLEMQNVPETPSEVRDRLRQYGNARSAGLKGWSADGRAYIGTRFGQTSQLHVVEEPGAARRQLTFYDEPVRTVVPSPTSPDHVLLTRDTGGNEQYQVVLLDTATGTETQLSDGRGRCETPTWSADGKQVAWVQTGEGSTRHVMVAALDDPTTSREVWTAEGYWGVSDWFPGDDRLLMFHYVAANESEVHVLDLAKGRAKQVHPSRAKIAWTDSALSPDGTTLYALNDEDADFTRLWRYDLTKKGGKGVGEVLEAPDADISDVHLTDDGAHLLYTTNEDGRSRLFMKKTADWTDAAVPELPAGIVYGIDSHDGQVALSLNRAAAPSDVYSFTLGETDLVRWTTSEVGGLDPDGFIEPTFFRTKSFDGLEIPAFVYTPEGPGPHPVVISIHGGPEGQSRPWFSTTYQFWARELGVAVVVPNVRGSTGFGRTYHQLDNGLKRKDSVADIGAILDWIAEQDGLDADRVVVQGGSYGGYMVLASLIDHGDRLAGGIDAVGISDFKTFLKNTKDYRRDLRRAEYGDERVPEIAAMFDAISPLKHADEIADPLFVIQGANDPRVPASEAEQIVQAVRENGQDVWYMLAQDEGHGFRKKDNRDRMNEAMAMFLHAVFGLD